MHISKQNDIWFSIVFVSIQYAPLKGQMHAFYLPSDFLFYSNPLLTHAGLHSFQHRFMRSYTGAIATGIICNNESSEFNKIFKFFLLFFPNIYYEFLHLLSFMKSSNNQLQHFVLCPLVKLDWSRTRSECPMTILSFSNIHNVASSMEVLWKV